MKNLLVYIVACAVLFPVRIFAQDSAPIVIADSLFVDKLSDSLSLAMSNKNYEKAYKFVQVLDHQDSLSFSTLYQCAECIKQTGKYDECLAFCSKWEQKFPKNDYGSMFAPLKAECYFYHGDYNTTAEYLSQYEANLKEYELELPPYYLGLYSTTLHKLNRYAEADHAFDSYFNEFLAEEDLLISEVSISNHKTYLGLMLYDYAYNSFFMGNESKGMNLLKLSSQCGHKRAMQDYSHLSKCATVMTDMNLDSNLTYQFENYLDLYDFQYNHTPNANISADFWRCMLKENTTYLELQDAMSKGTKSKPLQQALNVVASNKTKMQYYLNTKCQPYQVSDIEMGLVKQLVGGNTHTLTDFRIYPAGDANAFATPYGHIYLTSGLVLKYHLNNNLLLSICAHEITHYLCQHALVNLWKQYEKDQRNRIIGGIAAGLYAVAAIAGAGSSANYSGIVNNSLDLFTVISNASYYFQFKYSRSQEIESDLIAYRFCEAVGIGGYTYIMALQLLGENDLYMKANRTANHPTLSHRIAFLKWVYNKEHNVD